MPVQQRAIVGAYHAVPFPLVARVAGAPARASCNGTVRVQPRDKLVLHSASTRWTWAQSPAKCSSSIGAGWLGVWSVWCGTVRFVPFHMFMW